MAKGKEFSGNMNHRLPPSAHRDYWYTVDLSTAGAGVDAAVVGKWSRYFITGMDQGNPLPKKAFSPRLFHLSQ